MYYPKVKYQVITGSKVHQCVSKPVIKDGWVSATCVEFLNPLTEEFMEVKRNFNAEVVDHIVECNEQILEMIHKAWKAAHDNTVKQLAEDELKNSNISAEGLEEIPVEGE